MREKTKIGFTLIELLVVISIIGILAAFGTARYLTAEKGARDAQRKSDLNQYRTALENYASAHSSMYPVASGDIDNLCTLMVDYLSGACLNDVLAEEGVYSDYLYYSSSDGIDYVLAANLERSESDFIVCSNGLSGEGATPGSSTCTVGSSSGSSEPTVAPSSPPSGTTCYCCESGACKGVFLSGVSSCLPPWMTQSACLSTGVCSLMPNTCP
ncbi:MAG TPA: type II secretion system protein [Patescibacteria group bacterium]|nr:type II secretion system protein [Patescibacteria group bacterium]